MTRIHNTKKHKTAKDLGCELVHAACKIGRIGIEEVERLLVEGANVNYKDDAGRSPLHAAAYHGCYEIAKTLIQNGAKVDGQGGCYGGVNSHNRN